MSGPPGARCRTARAKPLLGLLDRLTELLEELVVVVTGQQMTRRDDHRNRPVDELECGQRRQAAVVGKLFGSRNLYLADDRRLTANVSPSRM